MIFDFLFGMHHCNHDKVDPSLDFEYCPDCGELIENQWYITRCTCCGVKQKSIVKNGKILPANNFCHNCGSNEFTVERLPKLNFFDVNFAVVVKKVFCSKTQESYTQSWVDAKQEADIQKLLPQSR